MNAALPSRVPPSNEPSEPENESVRSAVRFRALMLALVCTLLVFLVSSAADLLMLRNHEPVRFTIELSDALSAVVVGVLAFQLFRLQQQRRERLRQKVELIADMNHHVRNALQVIAFSSIGNTTEEIEAVKESVNRIQWALRELLPKI